VINYTDKRFPPKGGKLARPARDTTSWCERFLYYLAAKLTPLSAVIHVRLD